MKWKHAVLPLLAGAVFSLSAAAHAQYLEVTNFTGAAFGPTPSTPLTFNNLVLNESFADGTSQVVPLFINPTDAATQTNSLDNLTVLLDSAQLDPTHGALTAAQLTGDLSATHLTFPDGSQIDVPSSFVTNLFGPNIGSAPLGTLSLLDATGSNVIASVAITVTPEPGLFALTATFGLGLGSLLLRRRRATK